jgi:putative ABC transport system permease protein
VGIFTIMTIAVRERTAEVGLLRALGADRRQVLALFLAEAVVLSLLGGLAGLVFGAGVAWLLGEVVRQLPVSFSTPFMGLALGLSVVIGLVAGILPAMNASQLDPVEALRAE